MEQSILTSTKLILGLTEEDTSFDIDVATHVNSAFSDLHDLGVGPDDGFGIEDESTEWSELTTDVVALNRVKTFVYLKVRMLFDPPQTSFHIAAMEKQIQEAVWRLSVYREGTAWADPDPPVLMSDE